MPTVNELIDESLLGLGVYGESLSRCCLQTSRLDFSMSSKDLDRMNKIFEGGLKSSSLTVRIATLHGLMYWLEFIALGRQFYLFKAFIFPKVTDFSQNKVNLNVCFGKFIIFD